MPFIAILLDIFTAAAYFFQLHNPSTGLYLLGVLVQGVVTVLLLVITFSYRGKRLSRIVTPKNFFGRYRNFSFRYAVIVVSMFINALVLFLYVLNYLGINDLIFSAF